MVDPVSPEMLAAIRASSTCLSWKRASDLSATLRVLQGTCPTTTTKPSVDLHYAAVFPPANTPLRGVVFFLHGINEHCERYFHVFEALCGMGFGVVAYDLRSHGQSHMDVSGLIGHVDQFQSLIDDTNDVLTYTKHKLYPVMGVEADTKLVLMGMSLGTLVGIHTALTKQHEIAALVLAGPAVSVEMTWVLYFLSFLSSALSCMLPTARLVPGVNEAWICRDPLQGEDYRADPLTTSDPLTCRMAAETLAFMTTLKENKTVEDPESAFCSIPMLMVMGTDDKVTSLPVAQQFYDRLATKDKQFELIDGAYHVLFEDFERERVLSMICAWLHQRFPLPQ